MATCSLCGAETQLYDTGYPICIACSNAVLRNPTEDIGLIGNAAPTPDHIWPRDYRRSLWKYRTSDA
jgi:hypothetical protein